jgi:hypothetical protein
VTSTRLVLTTSDILPILVDPDFNTLVGPINPLISGEAPAYFIEAVMLPELESDVGFSKS